jgi:GMP reductase
MYNLIDEYVALDFDDVMILPSLTKLESRSNVDLTSRIHCEHSNRVISGIPIIAANMDSVGTVEASNTLGDTGCFTALHKFVSDEDLKNIKHKDKTFLTFGIVDVNEISQKLRIAGISEDRALLCLDVANGGMFKFIDYIKNVRQTFPKAFIIAGNCVDHMVASELRKSGASLVKVGIGSGSHCKTRQMTGVGMPQLQSVSNCSDVTMVVSDGGCKTVGDISKAFVGGATMVMIGTMLAGHKENVDKDLFTRWSWNWDNPSTTIKAPVRGMSSKAAMIDHYGDMASYRASEGHETEVFYRGTIKNTINEILGGLRSTCTYTNCHNIGNLKDASLIRVK